MPTASSFSELLCVIVEYTWKQDRLYMAYQTSCTISVSKLLVSGPGTPAGSHGYVYQQKGSVICNIWR